MNQTVTVYAAFKQDKDNAPGGKYLNNTGIEGGYIEDSGIRLYYEVCGTGEVAISGYSYNGTGDFKLTLPGYIKHGADDAQK